jgi:hypothetical protein
VQLACCKRGIIVDRAPSRFFVTGTAGLLGNHLCDSSSVAVRMGRSWSAPEPRQKRSLEKSYVEIVTGKMGDVSGFAQHQHGLDPLFHRAAYFRAGFKVYGVKLKLSDDGKKPLVDGYRGCSLLGCRETYRPWISGKKA